MKLGWLHKRRKSASELEVGPPLPLGNRSNGEYFHEQTEHERRIVALTHRRAGELARRHGLDRREFLASSMGMATSLWAINACRDGGDGDADTGNGYETGEPFECEPLTVPEFVFDVQTHHVDPAGEWRDRNPGYVDLLEGLPQAACGLEPLACYSAEQYLDLVFLDSDTSVAVLSGIPASVCTTAGSGVCGEPLDNEGIAATRDLIDALAGSPRSVNHAMVTPNVDLPRQLELMQQVVEEIGVAGFKCYPPWGPDGVGWRLDDPQVGLPFIERARELGVRTICIHKGIPLPGFDPVHTDPSDVAVVAAMYPDMDFIVYHSGFLHGGPGNGEGPYDPNDEFDAGNSTRFPVDMGVSSLVHAVVQQGLGPGSNVYADLGSVWANLLMLPDQAAHVLGKLVRYLGPDNVLWGTDCIFTGSPQPLIESFSAFTISEPFQETYGYAPLDDALKRKILGLNAAPLFGVDPQAVLCELPDDPLAVRKRALDEALGPRRWVVKPGLGPRTRREFVRMVRHSPGPG